MKPRQARPAAMVFLVLLVAWPWSSKEAPPPSPLPGDNGMDTSFGTIASPYRREFHAEAVPWEAEVVLKPDSTPGAARHLFALVSQSSTTHVRFTSLTTAEGQPIPIERDQREPGALVPQVFVLASDLPPAGTPILLRGDVEVENNGRYQVGSLVIAFDDQWRKVTTPQGEVAQLYSYGYVGASGVAGGAASPPFEGAGNVAPAAVLLLIVLGVGAAIAGGLFWLRPSRRAPPPPAPPAPPRAAPMPPPPARAPAARRPPVRQSSPPAPAGLPRPTRRTSNRGPSP